MLQLHHHDKSRVLADALTGTSNGANKPFLALVVLDLGVLLGEYGIDVATLNSSGNWKAHPRSVTDNQVERCSKEKVDPWRFVGLNKVLPWVPCRKGSSAYIGCSTLLL